MTETRKVHDPFLGKDVEVSNCLVDRLRGKYASGPHLPNGKPEFGWRQFEAPPIQHEAAAEIERLQFEILNYQMTLTEARNVLRPFASRDAMAPHVTDAPTAAATFLNKIGWGKEK